MQIIEAIANGNVEQLEEDSNTYESDDSDNWVTFADEISFVDIDSELFIIHWMSH